MEGYKCAIYICFRKMIARVKQEIVRCPVSRKGCYRIHVVSTAPDFLSIAPIFRSKHFLSLSLVVIAVWPATVGAFAQPENLFCRQFGIFFYRIKIGPECVELVPAVLGNIKGAVG